MSSPAESDGALVQTSRGDADACRRILREGSKSFFAASLLLPGRMRAPAAGVYAFCRVADDVVDEAPPGTIREAVESLHRRLDAIYAGKPIDEIADRAFAEVVEAFRIPKTIPLALLEGFQWDAEGRSYETLEELEGYCARVASTVGVMMTLLMGPRDREVLARACDLGLAMQLTNICRDVGEDARNGRVYLPRAWLEEEGVDPASLSASPTFSAALARVVERLLKAADHYYARADHGIGMLPRDCRLAIRAASLIYRDIGRVIARNQNDSVSQRAYTSTPRKAWLLFRALGAWFWRERRTGDAAQPAVAFLLEGVSP